MAPSNALLVAWAYTIATVVCGLPLTRLELLHSTSCTHGHQTLFPSRLKGVASKTTKTALSKNHYKIAAVTVGIILNEARSLLGLRPKKYGFTHIPRILVKYCSCSPYRVAFHRRFSDCQTWISIFKRTHMVAMRARAHCLPELSEEAPARSV